MDRLDRHWSLSNLSGDALVYRRFDAPREGAMPASEATALVRDWFEWQPSVLLSMHDAIAARASRDAGAHGEARRIMVVTALEEAFRRGELIAVRVPYWFPIRKVEKAEENVLGPQAPVEEEEKKTWIEISVKDALGEPAKDLAYKLRTPDGQWKEGKTDGSGKIRLDDVHPGYCELTFPPPPPPAG